MKVLMIDNYDSFTYNLVQYIGEVDEPPEVVRNDDWSPGEVRDFDPRAVVISPGPGDPTDAGVSVPLIRELGDRIPILGVCLGHQCVGAAYGAKIVPAARLLHGKTSRIYAADNPLYRELPRPFTATRYHSLIVEEDSLPDVLRVNAVSERGEIMGIHHVDYPVMGVQFHPESILTENGRQLIRNFLEYARDPRPIGRVNPPEVPQVEGEPAP